MKHLMLFCCLFFALNTNGQTLPLNQLRSDFDYLRESLEEAHGGLYRHHTKDQIDRLFDKYRRELKQPMSALEYYRFLSKLLSSIGDGHMKLEYSGDLPNPYQFPYRILLEKDKATVLSNDTPTDTIIKPGMSLLSVNNRSFKSLKKSILPCLISDGYNQTGKTNRLERNFSQLYKVFVDTSSFFSIRARDSSGKVVESNIQGVKNAERENNRLLNPVNAKTMARTNYLEGSKENISLRFLENGIAALRIRYFVGDRFRQELDSVFRLILGQNTRALILDIRGNGGGLDHYGAYTAAKFVTQPFRYLDKVRARVLVPSRADWKAKPPVDLTNGTEPDPKGGYLLKPMLNSALELQQPAEHPYTGKLVILIDGRTFSAASDFSAIISNIAKPVLVGVETGGGYQGNTSGLNEILKLPHSRFSVNIHLWDYWSAVGPPKLKSRGVVPDFKVERKTADWLNGTDTQWEFALMLCKGM